MYILAVAETKKVAKSLKISSHTIEEAWKIKYLGSAAGKQYMENLQKDQLCLIFPEKADKSSEKQSATKLSSKRAPNAVSLEVNL